MFILSLIILLIINVTECFTGSFRFDLELKTDMKSPVSWWSSIIDEAALSTWELTWGWKPVSTCQHVCSEKSVSVYSNSSPALTCWAEQISILSWLWSHICSIWSYWVLHLWSSITLSHWTSWLLLTACRAIFIVSWSQELFC